jgi:dTDP-4-amino-4,6-dideoxygalactose transaminase
MSNKIGLFQTHRVWESIKAQIFELTETQHTKGLAQNGDLVQSLEKRLADKFGRKHCVTTASCTDALTIAVGLLDLPTGSKVGVPNYTFTATAHAVARAGYQVVPLEVTNNYCVDPGKIHNISALVNVDLFGNMSDWSALNQLEIPVINDAAQSMDSRDTNGWSVGKGLVSCISFSPSKPISSWGSGGALLTDSDELADRARKLRLHGKISNDSQSISTGLNSMLSSFEAAAVWSALDYSTEWQSRRLKIAQYLMESSVHSSSIDLNLPSHTLSKLVFQTSDLQSVMLKFRADNIDCVTHYKLLINDEKIYHLDRNLSVSNHLKHISFTVPNQHTLNDDEVERIAKALK